MALGCAAAARERLRRVGAETRCITLVLPLVFLCGPQRNGSADTYSCMTR